MELSVVTGSTLMETIEELTPKNKLLLLDLLEICARKKTSILVDFIERNKKVIPLIINEHDERGQRLFLTPYKIIVI
jgi:hypothetical protein